VELGKHAWTDGGMRDWRFWMCASRAEVDIVAILELGMSIFAAVVDSGVS